LNFGKRDAHKRGEHLCSLGREEQQLELAVGCTLSLMACLSRSLFAYFNRLFLLLFIAYFCRSSRAFFSAKLKVVDCRFMRGAPPAELS